MPNPIGRALRNRRAGHETLAWSDPRLSTAAEFTLSSPAFEHGSPIPEKHRGRIFGANVSPRLEWSDPPGGTQELVLIVQDPDVPFATPATHALVVGIGSSRRTLDENALVHPSPIAGIRHGNGPAGRRGYAGPAPIPSHGPHSYVFQLFALDAQLALPARFSLGDVVDAMAGHVVGRARLDGTYENP